MLGESSTRHNPTDYKPAEVKQRADDDLVQYGQGQSLFKIGTY